MTRMPDGAIPACAGADPHPRAPRFRPPEHACDCHAHVFGPAGTYPFTHHRSYTPPEAPLAQYRALLATLGLSRAVIVQPSVYATDNRATLDAVNAGGAAFRGVVVVDESVPDKELEAMNAAGVRGVRVNLLFKSGLQVPNLRRLSARIAPFGWHLQLLVDVSKFADLRATLGDLPVDTVFDHMGHMPTSLGVAHPGFQAMLHLLGGGRSWVKLSGAYRITAGTSPPYFDVVPFARAIIATNPERVLWASDWPHPGITVPMPNDGDLLDLLSDWAPDATARQRILSDNPAKLYGFSA